VLLGRGYSLEVDLWGLGVAIYFMLTGRGFCSLFLSLLSLTLLSPFNDANVNITYKNIMNLNYTMPSTFDKATKDIISNLLELDPEKRLGCGVDGIKKLKSHSWFKEINWDELSREEMTPPFIPS